jgi:2-dehydro-3-deoxygluconokinase
MSVVDGGLITFGETMGLVTALEIGPLDAARTFTLSIGGAESNVAVGAARLGAAVTWFGRIGNDDTGTMIERRLRSEQIETLAIRDSSYTGLMVKHRRFGTSLHVDYHRAGSAGSRLCASDVPVERVQAASILHVTGITPALSESSRDAVFHAVEVARSAGVAVSVDVNYRSKLWDAATAAPVLRELIAHADVAFAGTAEAALVTGASASLPAADLARALAERGPTECVIKDGARGCTAVLAGDVHHHPALPVAVVDPVGAGDAFVAGYLVERLRDADAPTRLSTANAAGAFAVSVAGDCEGLPRRDELAALDGVQVVTR